MGDIIKINNSSYDRYEELILQRDALIKECNQIELQYILEFGELIIAVFDKQIECIQKKKTIEFCQMAANHGNEVNRKELQEYVDRETKKFRENLDRMIEDYEESKDAEKISEADLMEIRAIYRRIVKQIHPDINPMISDSEKLKDLWLKVSSAYRCNDLEYLKELEVVVAKAVIEASGGQIEIDIPDIDDKISKLEKEIKDIMSKDPYMYKFLLNDPDSVIEKKKSLKEELNQYEYYSRQLDEILEGLLADGVSIKWEMN